MDDITSHICRLAKGSIPDEGSSNSKSLGDPIREIARDNLRLFPPILGQNEVAINVKNEFGLK